MLGASTSVPEDRLSLAVVQAKATQFDGPFFRYLSRHTNLELTVYYTETASALAPYDPELKRCPDWDNDAVSGYRFEVFPEPLLGRIRIGLRVVTSKPDLIILSGVRSFDNFFILICSFFARIAVGFRSDNCITQAGQSTWRGALRALVYRRLLRFFKTGHPVGTLAEEHLVSLGVAKSRIFRFPYLVDTATLVARFEAFQPRRLFLRASYGIGSDDFVILGVLKLLAREDPLTLVRAFVSMMELQRNSMKSMRSAHLILVGDGDLRPEIEALIRDHQISTVHMPGYVNYTRLPEFFAIADVLVHPAIGESWGVTVNEAMVCGLPVLAAQTVGSARDLIRNGVDGLTFPPGDSGALAEILRVLLSEPGTLTRMRSKCADSAAHTVFNYSRTANELRNAIRFVTGRRPVEDNLPLSQWNRDSVRDGAPRPSQT
jgi:glycosyltransferase involved in cell wall biosynthesis